MKRKQSIIPIILCLLVFGCKLGPEPKRPPTVAEKAEAFINAPDSQRKDPPNLVKWWESFSDDVTNALVEEAIEKNTDLKAAAARVLEGKALFRAASGRRLPVVGADFSRDRRKNSFSLPSLGRVGVLSTTYNLGLSVSWQADLFGKLARSEQAAWADLLSAEASREAVLHTVIAEVVRLRAKIATLQRQLAIARANIESWRNSRDIIERRYNRGVTSALDLRLARENLAAARAAEPEIAYRLKVAMHALDVMLNRQPGSGKDLPETLSDLPPLEPPPVGLPVSLLDRRPDLKATELRAAAATARIGVALADLYPDLNLSARGGYSADKLHDLFRPDTQIYNFLGDLAWKIYAGGALRAQVEAAEARAEAAAAEYATAVLNALREVEDALVREDTARRRYKELEIRLEEAVAAERLAGQRYLRGVEPLVVVLDSERRRRVARDALNITQGVLWDARINLYMALGGDWKAQEKQGSEEDVEQREDSKEK